MPIAYYNEDQKCMLTSDYGYRIHPVLGLKWNAGGHGLLFHAGIDIRAEKGSEILSATEGIVVSANWDGGYGKCVKIKFDNDYEIRYGHLSKINVYKGQKVKKGEVIGIIGSTGLSTGTHLHFEIRYKDEHINPNLFL